MITRSVLLDTKISDFPVIRYLVAYTSLFMGVSDHTPTHHFWLQTPSNCPLKHHCSDMHNIKEFFFYYSSFYKLCEIATKKAMYTKIKPLLQNKDRGIHVAQYFAMPLYYLSSFYLLHGDINDTAYALFSPTLLACMIDSITALSLSITASSQIWTVG